MKHAAGTTPRTVDLSGIQVSLTTAAILSDIFAIEWGLRKLVFRECDLDEYVSSTLHFSLHPCALPPEELICIHGSNFIV